LPTGKVLFWQTWTESTGLWDPVSNQFSTADVPLHNPFCAGHAWLADGRLLVVGGHVSNDNGEHRANIYNPWTNTWTDNVPNMPSLSNPPSPYVTGQRGRWYPSATTLGNGDVLVMAGGMNGNFNPDNNPLPQVYQASTNTWRNLTSAYKDLPYYPRTFLLPNGNVVSTADYDNRTQFINPTGTGSWSSYTTSTLDDAIVDYGSAVMYEPGKVAYFGGGYVTNKIATIDLTVPRPTWSYAAEHMAQPRRQHNATILADGTVLITGGSSADEWNDPSTLVTQAEIWDPVTQEVTQVANANASIFRGYHSVALLLPDGRVLSAGGNHDLPTYSENRNAEIYSPPYLFKGPRPTVTAAPTSAELGRTFFVATPDADDISKVTFVVPGSVTHSQNWTQRINYLDFEEVPGGLAITLPENANEAPVGYYMMFLVNSNGVPSMANFMRALPKSAGLAGDFNSDGVVDARDYVVYRKGAGSTYDYGDFIDWKRHFGQMGGSGASAPTVPQPSGVVMGGILLMVYGFCYRRSANRVGCR